MKLFKLFYKWNGCNFGSDCAYRHGKNNDAIKADETDARKLVNKENVTVNTEDTHMKDKVTMLEAVVQKMFLNIIKLEAEVTELKVKTKNIIKEADVKDNFLTGKKSKENILSSKPLNTIDQKDVSKSNDDFKCEMWECSTKKRNMPNKHMNTKRRKNIWE